MVKVDSTWWKSRCFGGVLPSHEGRVLGGRIDTDERKLAQDFLVLCLFLAIIRTEASTIPVMIVDCHGNSGILVYVRILVYSVLSAATEYRVTNLLLVESTIVNVNGSLVSGAIVEVVGVVNVTKTTLPSEP
jgi:hypothetical protein